MPDWQPQPDPPEKVARGSTLWVANLGKAAGIVAFLNEVFLEPTPRPKALAVIVLLVMGAHAFERMVLKVIESIFRR